MIRNVSTSQDMRSNKIDKSNESPRVINSNELIESLMNKSANRLFNRKRDGLRDYKRKKESSSRESQERSGYMMNVSNYFKELKKQNESFIKWSSVYFYASPTGLWIMVGEALARILKYKGQLIILSWY